MSSFVLERRYALQVPGSYVDVDAEEMEYIDGGWWSLTTLTKNLVGLAALSTAVAVLYNRHIKPILDASPTIWRLSARMAPFMAKIGSAIGGPVGLTVLGLSIIAAIYFLGTKNLFF